MFRRDFLASSIGASLSGFAQGRVRPNFLFLFTDDQRFDTIRALGNPEVHTPTMDRLARRGMVFTHAMIQGGSSGAVCMPSRASLMSGQNLFHAHNNICASPNAGVSRTPFSLFPELLGKSGYQTFMTGKWHNGPVLLNRAFSSGADIFLGGMSDHLKVPARPYDPSGRYAKEDIRVQDRFSSEIFADASIGFLRKHDKARPFLLYNSFTSPHDPRMAPQRFASLYDPAKIRIPPNFLAQHPFDNGELKVRDEMLAPFPRTEEEIRRHIAAYYSMISEVDHQMGRVLQALEESGEADKTVIVFAADNGLAVGRHGLLGKQNLYEHSIRVPLIIAGPGIPADRRSAAMVHLMDVGPTILETAGLNVPGDVDGRSLRGIIDGRSRTVRDCAISAYRHFQRALRTEDWKLICYNVEGTKTTQLFDLRNDPYEMRNLSAEPAHKARVAELKARLQRELRAAGDTVELDAANWTPFA